jgi:glycerol uptake facilitator-like aquaporin
MTLGIMVLAIGKVSGAHLNPAITLGLWSNRKISTPQSIVYIAAQLLGAAGALLLAQYFIGSDLTELATSKFDAKVLVAEGVGALVFGYGVAAAVYQKFEGLQAAATIGTSLFLGILVASLGSNGVLNPAVAVGINSFNVNYALGPIVGVFVGMQLYKLFMVTPEKAAVKAASTSAAKKKPATKKKK